MEHDRTDCTDDRPARRPGSGGEPQPRTRPPCPLPPARLAALVGGATRTPDPPRRARCRRRGWARREFEYRTACGHALLKAKAELRRRRQAGDDAPKFGQWIKATFGVRFYRTANDD